MVVVSVQHTGSRFLCERLGLDSNEIIHTNQPAETVIQKVGDRDIITPLRDPADVWHSWCKRGKEDQRIPFLYSWYVLKLLTQKRPIDFIAVDKQEDSRITDWSKVCHNPKATECPHIDLSSVYSLPFMRAQYGN